MLRYYHLNATVFIGDYVTLEVHSDREHYGLPAKLARRGLTVRNAQWRRFDSNPNRLHGTGYADKPMRFFASYEVERCHHCPIAETEQFVKDTYRIIDDINAKWFP